MVDLTLPTTALQNLRTSKTSLEQYIAHLEQVMVEFRECDCTAGQTILDTQAEAALQSYLSSLQAAQSAFQNYHNALMIDRTTADAQQIQDALSQLGISTTVQSGGLGGDAGWERGSNERLKEAHRAVTNIINKIAVESFRGDTLIGALQFLRTFGGTALQLTVERTQRHHALCGNAKSGW